MLFLVLFYICVRNLHDLSAFMQSHCCDICAPSFLKWRVFPFGVRCTRCIIQKNPTEIQELWTQFCRQPNLKDMETTTWFYGACSACCGDYFGGRGHCVEMIVSEENKKIIEQNWSHSVLLGSVVEMGSRPPGPCDTDQGPRRISAYYISWSGKHANNKCMSNVLVFLLD